MLYSPSMEIIENLKSHLKVLSGDIGSRSIQEPGKLEAAALYIESELGSAGLHVLRQEYEAHGVPTANLVARTPNWAGDAPVTVLGAHYDTVRATPGADDNASAVAVLIETGRKIMAEAPEKSGNLLFVAFSTEEPPCFASDLMGSRIFTERVKGSDMEIRGALVLEMVGYFSDKAGSQSIPDGLESLGLPDVGNFIALAADQQSAELAEWVHLGMEESGSILPVIKLVDPGHHPELSSLMRLSDNASFWDAGIPALMITDTSFLRNSNYHKDTDTADTLDYEAMGKLVKALVHTLVQPS